MKQLALLLCVAVSAIPIAARQSDRLDTSRLEGIERVVRSAVDEKQLPGAVILVGRGDKVLYRTAIGNRAVQPAVEPMTVDTIFDLASLTKVVATTTSVMMLEIGRAHV